MNFIIYIEIILVILMEKIILYGLEYICRVLPKHHGLAYDTFYQTSYKDNNVFFYFSF